MSGRENEQGRREHQGSADAQPTADQLRAEIDSGRAQDKVSHPDPAAAPLGTDAEASGNAPTIEEVELARKREVAGRKCRAASARRSRRRRRSAAMASSRAGGILCAVVALAAW